MAVNPPDDDELLDAVPLPHGQPPVALPSALRDAPIIDPWSQRTRQFRLTEARYDKAIALVQMGNHPSVAGAAAGLGADGLERYARIGREINDWLIEVLGENHEVDHTWQNPWPDRLTNDKWRCFRAFSAIQSAEAEAEAYAVTMLRKHLVDSPGAVMAFLERRHPQRWRKRHSLEVVQGTTEDTEDQGLLASDAVAKVNDALRIARDKQGLNAGQDSTGGSEAPDSPSGPRPSG